MTCTAFLGRVLCLNKVAARVGQQPRKSYVIAVDEVTPVLAGTKLRRPRSWPLEVQSVPWLVLFYRLFWKATRWNLEPVLRLPPPLV